jgi:hypothetical protein
MVDGSVSAAESIYRVGHKEGWKELCWAARAARARASLSTIFHDIDWRIGTPARCVHVDGENDTRPAAAADQINKEPDVTTSFLEKKIQIFFGLFLCLRSFGIQKNKKGNWRPIGGDQ